MAKKPGLIDVKVRMTERYTPQNSEGGRAGGQTLNAEILKRLDDSFEIRKLFDKLLGAVEGHHRKARARYRERKNSGAARAKI